MSRQPAAATPDIRYEAEEMLQLVVGVATTAVAAIVAMGAAGLLPAWVALAGAVLAVLAAGSLVRWPSGAVARLRRQIGIPAVGACALVSALVLLSRTRSAAGDASLLVDSIGTTLAYPVAALVVVQLAAAVTARHIATTLVCCGLGMFLCIVTVSTTVDVEVASGFGICLVVGWISGVVTVWRLHDVRQRNGALVTLPGDRTPALIAPLALAATSLVIALLALSVLPDPEGIRQLGDRTSTGADDRAADAMDAGVRTPTSYLSDSMDLNARGELPTTELVAVPTDGGALWGGAQFDVYTGSGWRSSASTAFVPATLGSTGEYDIRGTAAASLSFAPAAVDRLDGVRPLSDTVRLPLLAPGQPVAARIDDVLFVRGRTVLPSSFARPYLVRSRQDVADSVTAADARLPDTVPTRVRNLAERLTRGAASVEAKVAAIEDHLRSTARYRLDSPVPDDGDDAVDDFLFESKEGFCEHFAAAEVVLLRAVGVPARVVTGFAGGDLRGDLRVMRGSDAHAWVQVHRGEGEWFWTDPTAGSTLAEDEPNAVLRLLREHWQLVLGGAAGALLLAVAGALAARRVRSRRAALRAAAAPLTVKLIAVFGALESALARTALARRPVVSVEEWRRVLLSRWPGGLPEADRVELAFAAVQRVLYDRTPLPAEQATAAIAVLGNLTALAADVLPTPANRTLVSPGPR